MTQNLFSNLFSLCHKLLNVKKLSNVAAVLILLNKKKMLSATLNNTEETRRQNISTLIVVWLGAGLRQVKAGQLKQTKTVNVLVLAGKLFILKLKRNYILGLWNKGSKVLL